MSVKFALVASGDALRDDLVLAVVDRACIGDQAPARTKAEFERRAEEARGRLGLLSEELCERVGRILDAHQSVARALAALPAAVSADARADIKEHVARLVYAGFVTRTPWSRLPHLARYMRAAELRIREALASSASGLGAGGPGHTAVSPVPRARARRGAPRDVRRRARALSMAARGVAGVTLRAGAQDRRTGVGEEAGGAVGQGLAVIRGVTPRRPSCDRGSSRSARWRRRSLNLVRSSRNPSGRSLSMSACRAPQRTWPSRYVYPACSVCPDVSSTPRKRQGQLHLVGREVFGVGPVERAVLRDPMHHRPRAGKGGRPFPLELEIVHPIHEHAFGRLLRARQHDPEQRVDHARRPLVADSKHQGRHAVHRRDDG